MAQVEASRMRTPSLSELTVAPRLGEPSLSAFRLGSSTTSHAPKTASASGLACKPCMKWSAAASAACFSALSCCLRRAAFSRSVDGGRR